NADESGLFPFAPPDQGLASTQMAGKKKEKFRSMMLFMCNTDESECLPPMYISNIRIPSI
ncbi:hypothetical protein L208DRAFT_1283815, partial [Tricholoma matsutake]